MQSSSPDDALWIRCFQPCPPASVRLVCFPHAGGSASYYFPLAQSLAPGIEVLAVQYPGRQDRRLEPFIDNIPELADHIFDTLSRRPADPFAFFGHSMGAVLAFEVACRFQRGGGSAPLHLFGSGRRAPSRYRPGDIHRRDDAAIVTELRSVGGTDERFLGDAELLATILQVTRNDYRAIETYRWAPRPPLGCPITALVGDADPHTTVDEAAAWAEHTSGAFDLRIFPGGHFYFDASYRGVIDTITGALRNRSRVDSRDGGMS